MPNQVWDEFIWFRVFQSIMYDICNYNLDLCISPQGSVLLTYVIFNQRHEFILTLTTMAFTTNKAAMATQITCGLCISNSTFTFLSTADKWVIFTRHAINESGAHIAGRFYVNCIG